MAKNPQIAVDISAVDQFSATMGRFRQELAKVNRPLTQLRENMDQQASSAPFAGIGEGLDLLRARAQNAAGGLSGLAPGIAALTGLGTVAGLARAAVDFGQFGTSLQNTARMAGISAGQLYTLQGAARITGVSAETASSMVVGLNHARFGRNNAAAGWMAQLQIPADTQKALPRIADLVRGMAKTSPVAAERFAGIFGIGSDALPLLIKGGDALAALQAEVARSAGDMNKAIEAANNYTAAQGRLENATLGLRNTMMTALEPSFTPIVNGFSAWIAKQSETEAGAKRLATAAELVGGTALFSALFGRAAAGGAIRAMAPLALLGLTGPAGGEDADFSRQKNDEYLRNHPHGSGLGNWLHDHLPDWMTGGGPNRLPTTGSSAPNGVPPPQGSGLGDWLHEHLPDWMMGGGPNRLPTMGRSAPNGVPPTGPRFGPQGGGAGSVDGSLTPGMRGLLDTIAGPESGGRYNVSNGGATFSDMSRHPGYMGGKSTAAGRYQFIQGTWDAAQRALGLPDFSPASQDKAAAWLAARDYRTKTGRNLQGDLNSPDPAVRKGIASALASTWSSLPGGVEQSTSSERFLATLDAARKRYADQAVPMRVAPAEEPDLTRGGRLPATLATPAPPVTANNGSSTVHISLTAPEGMGMQARTEGGGADIGSIRLRTPMPDAGRLPSGGY